MSDLLFVYGTLHPTRAPREIADVARKLTSLGPGTIHARLYQLGSFPGVVLDSTTPEIVHGEVFAIPDAQTLARLDHYEDFRPDDPDSSLFLRQTTTVKMDDGTQQTCWVYVYNQRLPTPAK